MKSDNIKDTFPYDEFTFFFDFPNGQFHSVPTNNDQGAHKFYSFESEPLVLKMDSPGRKLKVLKEQKKHDTKRQFVLVNLETFAGIQVSHFHDRDGRLRSLIAAGGIGVTDLLDTDPIDIDYLNFDFDREYRIFKDSIIYKISSIEIQKVQVEQIVWHCTANNQSKPITQDFSKRKGLVFTVQFYRPKLL